MTVADLLTPPLQVVRHANGALLLVSFTVFGTPAPQGSKKAFVNRHTGRVNLKESSAKVRPWREAVKVAITSETGGTVLFTKPVAVSVLLDFYLKRPAGHYGTGKNAGVLKDWALAARPTGKPDIDKLERSTLDGLGEAGIYGDDSQVVTVTATKHYADGPERLPVPGARINVALAGAA